MSDQEEVRETTQQCTDRINRREVRRSAAIILKCVRQTLARHDNVHIEAVLRSV
jgi:hypothetical protein